MVGHVLLLRGVRLRLHNGLMFVALEHTRANTGAVINGAIPVVMMILDWAIFRRTIAPWSVAGAAAGRRGGHRRHAWRRAPCGAARWVTVSSCSWSRLPAGRCHDRFASLLERHAALAVTTWACLAGGPLMLPGALCNLEATACC